MSDRSLFAPIDLAAVAVGAAMLLAPLATAAFMPDPQGPPMHGTAPATPAGSTPGPSAGERTEAGAAARAAAVGTAPILPEPPAPGGLESERAGAPGTPFPPETGSDAGAPGP